MLGFLRFRAIPGMEQVVDGEFMRTLRLEQGERTRVGWLRVRFDKDRAQAVLTASDSLAAALPTLINRVRATLDLDADPIAIHAALHTAFPSSDGVRVPGTLDGFELAVRAVLGQQITVAAARTLGKRLVAAFGDPIETPSRAWIIFSPPLPLWPPRPATNWAGWASRANARPRCMPWHEPSWPAASPCIPA